MNCNEARPLLSALFDGELERPDAVQTHYRSCPECGELLARFERARGLLAARADLAAPDGLWQRIAEAAGRPVVRPWSLQHVAAALVGALLYVGAFQVLDARLHAGPAAPRPDGEATQTASLLGDLHRRLAAGELGGAEPDLGAAAELLLLRQILENKESGR